MPRVIFDWDKKTNNGVIISDFLDDIRAHFSVPNKAASIIERKYGNSFVQKRLHAIKNSGRFAPGLYFNIIQFLKKSSIDYEIITTDLFYDNIICNILTEDFEIDPLNMELRDFQESGVYSGLKFGYGVFLIGTGGGKTYLMALLERSFRTLKDTNFNTIVALPAQLVIQTCNDFVEYGIPREDICCWSGKNELELKPIIIASYKTLHSKLNSFVNRKPKSEDEFIDQCKDTEYTNYQAYLKEFRKHSHERNLAWNRRKRSFLKQLSDVDLMLLDEVHFLRSKNKLNKLLKYFATRHKFGFTGTMPEDKIDEWNIIGKIGPVIEHVTSYDLRKRRYLSNARVSVIHITYNNPPIIKPNFDKPSEAYNIECDFVYNNIYRNNVIAHISKQCKNNALIMVDRIAHGELLYKIIKKKAPKKRVYWICGEMAIKEREKIRALMEEEDNIVCIAITKIFSTGINIKNLHYVIFAQNGKAKITIVQSIGRGLRLNENKEILIIVDIADDLLYGNGHLKARLKRYSLEKIEYEIKKIKENK